MYLTIKGPGFLFTVMDKEEDIWIVLGEKGLPNWWSNWGRSLLRSLQFGNFNSFLEDFSFSLSPSFPPFCFPFSPPFLFLSEFNCLKLNYTQNSIIVSKVSRNSKDWISFFLPTPPFPSQEVKVSYQANDPTLRIFHFQDFYFAPICIASGRKHISLWTPGLSNISHNTSTKVSSQFSVAHHSWKWEQVTFKIFHGLGSPCPQM